MIEIEYILVVDFDEGKDYKITEKDEIHQYLNNISQMRDVALIRYINGFYELKNGGKAKDIHVTCCGDDIVLVTPYSFYRPPMYNIDFVVVVDATYGIDKVYYQHINTDKGDYEISNLITMIQKTSI